MSAVVISAVNCVAFTKVVARSLPLNLTVAPSTKPRPLTVSVKPLSPAVTLAGESPLMAGLTVKLTAADVPPRGFMTAIGSDPIPAISEARMVAVNWVLLTKVVGRSEPLK